MSNGADKISLLLGMMQKYNYAATVFWRLSVVERCYLLYILLHVTSSTYTNSKQNIWWYGASTYKYLSFQIIPTCCFSDYMARKIVNTYGNVQWNIIHSFVYVHPSRLVGLNKDYLSLDQSLDIGNNFVGLDLQKKVLNNVVFLSLQ